jgi:hypothetical protein
MKKGRQIEEHERRHKSAHQASARHPASHPQKEEHEESRYERTLESVKEHLITFFRGQALLGEIFFSWSDSQLFYALQKSRDLDIVETICNPRPQYQCSPQSDHDRQYADK